MLRRPYKPLLEMVWYKYFIFVVRYYTFPISFGEQCFKSLMNLTTLNIYTTYVVLVKQATTIFALVIRRSAGSYVALHNTVIFGSN